MKIVCTDFHGKKHFVDADKLTNRLSVYGVCIVNNAVLLIQDPRSLRWELPGGGVEVGETPEHTLAREFIEETGTKPTGYITFIKEWEEYFFDVISQQAWHSKRIFFRVEKIDNQMDLLTQGNGEDSARAEFVPIEKLRTLNIASNIKQLIRTSSTE
ncbi:MAG TPA: NUDIX domain-containing protein [Candidatus Saccharimonadales bacterium]|nr:NUDIX domain-containing protein [Candidatus Saccharimonadales bacterium]